MKKNDSFFSLSLLKNVLPSLHCQGEVYLNLSYRYWLVCFVFLILQSQSQNCITITCLPVVKGLAGPCKTVTQA